jgi:hypothetical protein
LARWRQFFQGLLFIGEVGLQVKVSCLDMLMAKPQRNHSNVHAGVQQVSCRGGAQRVGRDLLGDARPLRRQSASFPRHFGGEWDIGSPVLHRARK